jgi:hypothetical protein
VVGAVVGISAFKFGQVFTEYFWGIAGTLILGALPVVLFYRHRTESQIVARKDTIEGVAQELCTILEEQGGKSNLNDLKSKLHISCRPYFDLAIALLSRNKEIEWS